MFPCRLDHILSVFHRVTCICARHATHAIKNPHRHLASELHPSHWCHRGTWMRIVHCIIPHCCYHTLGHYPGHMVCYHPCLVNVSFRSFPQFDGVASCPAAVDRNLQSCFPLAYRPTCLCVLVCFTLGRRSGYCSGKSNSTVAHGWPLPKKSRKSSQSVNPYFVWTWWVSPCWVKLSRRFHAWCALPSIPLSFQLALVLSPEPKNFDFS